MKRFRLKYASEQMEEEYSSLQAEANNQNIQLTCYLLLFLLIVSGIPAIINKCVMDIIITAVTGVLIIIISFWKMIPRKYVQLLLAVVITTFCCIIYVLPSFDYGKAKKSKLFSQGYGFACLNMGLLTRISSLRQKLFFLIYAFVFHTVPLLRFEFNIDSIFGLFKGIYICLFVAAITFLDERRKRLIFKRFYEFREELSKFKELLANYLPQSITVFKNLMEKPLFSNKAFSNNFDQLEGEVIPNIYSLTSLSSARGISAEPQHPKPRLSSLKVDKSAMREIGEDFENLWLSNESEPLPDVLNEILQKRLLDEKTISLPASYSQQDQNKSFEVILTKIKWDSEDAVAIILSDTTYQEKILSLKIANANKDKIIATVSHELRTPLNGIIGILDIVNKRVEDEKTQGYVELCRDNAYLLMGLVNSLLDLHQVRQGRLKLNISKIETRRLLEDIRRLFMFQAAQKGINLTLNVDKNVPLYISTDENRFKQILINLLGNALKFTFQGNITIEATQDSDDQNNIQVSVSDTGVGIKEEDISKLFHLNETVGEEKGVNKNGVGLGLTISNTLAGILNGKREEKAIKVTSKVDEGSKFSFKVLTSLEASFLRKEKKENQEVLEQLGCWDDAISFNVSSEDELKIPKESRRKSIRLPNTSSQVRVNMFTKLASSQILLPTISGYRKNLLTTLNSASLIKGTTQTSPLYKRYCAEKGDSKKEKGCILAVDDNPFNLIVVENIVKGIGYFFQKAQSGHEAIEMVKSREKEPLPYELILMDCQMPIMDGYETARTLKEMMKKEEVRNVPIIALTANNGEEDIKRCYESGMVNHLSKPLFAEALSKAIAALEG